MYMNMIIQLWNLLEYSVYMQRLYVVFVINVINFHVKCTALIENEQASLWVDPTRIVIF